MEGVAISYLSTGDKRFQMSTQCSIPYTLQPVDSSCRAKILPEGLHESYFL